MLFAFSVGLRDCRDCIHFLFLTEKINKKNQIDIFNGLMIFSKKREVISNRVCIYFIYHYNE